MPVYKYRTFEEAGQHLKELLPADPLERLARLQELIKTLRPAKRIEQGIFRFKTLDEANRHREEQNTKLK